MREEDFKRFDRNEHPWHTPEVPTGELMERNPGYKIRAIRNPEAIRIVVRRQLIDQILRDLGYQNFTEASQQDKKRLRLMLSQIDEKVEKAVSEIVWAVQTQANYVVKIFEINNITQLTGKDAESFQKLFLDGLYRFPSAFGTTKAIEEKKGLDEIAKWIESRAVYGVCHKDYKTGDKKIKLVGVGRLEIKEGAMAHEGYMGTLYVDDEYWGNGFGDMLTKTRLDKALEMGLHSVEITVTKTNKFVMEYFTELGFIKRGERTGVIGGKAYPWVDLWLPMELWRRRREKEAQQTTTESTETVPPEPILLSENNNDD